FCVWSAMYRIFVAQACHGPNHLQSRLAPATLNRMITFLDGELVEKQPTRIVLAVGGIGYDVSIPLSSYDKLPRQGERCRVLTVDYIREDTHNLYGFMTEAERGLFGLLIGTSGIGPKLALSALSGLSVRELKAAVVEGDVKRLSSISGIGKKMAERLVVELRDRIDPGDALEAIAGHDASAETNSVIRDSILALVALGYKQEAAHKMVLAAVNHAGGNASSVESTVRKALGG
ncbi:MAG: Holliday junction branch migration protein RuvA, partial [Verrucomicrobia bacterium]|nr:Holliday junction branch migration protein RuvA [Verrucomicrobiota bacterium]